MSGPATVPFAIAALYVSSDRYRALYGALAILCAGYTSYRMWLTERVALEAELNENQIPKIGLEIERVYITPVGVRGAKVFVLASVHNLNAAIPCTLKRYELTICVAGRDYSGTELPVTGFQMSLGQPRMSVADSTGLQDGPLSDLNDAVTGESPLRRGIPVHGWLSFGFDNLPPWPVTLSQESDSGRFDTSVVLSATLGVVDAFNGKHTAALRKPPWRNVGTISPIPMILSIEELTEAMIELSRQAKKEQRIPHVAISESEFADHFTESRARISQALVVLERQGRAKKTSMPEYWSF
jgi:hypothetical protein